MASLHRDVCRCPITSWCSQRAVSHRAAVAMTGNRSSRDAIGNEFSLSNTSSECSAVHDWHSRHRMQWPLRVARTSSEEQVMKRTMNIKFASLLALTTMALAAGCATSPEDEQPGEDRLVTIEQKSETDPAVVP